jgi:hypothetical protein
LLFIFRRARRRHRRRRRMSNELQAMRGGQPSQSPDSSVRFARFFQLSPGVTIYFEQMSEALQ